MRNTSPHLECRGECIEPVQAKGAAARPQTCYTKPMTFYRTYRPQQFRDLVGQEPAVRTLQQALLKDRLAHAYLFTGSRGTGKTSCARILARAVSCPSPETGPDSFEPCGSCEICQELLAGRCGDLLEIDAASNRGIEDIRELREQTHYPPQRLKKKVYIIDEVHMLTGEAFNALLKTLEEPPAHCLFILATTELHKVPITIRSRCQLIRFERGSLESIERKLDRVIKAEKLDVEKGVSLVLARHADGGFRDAETLLENLSTHYSPLTLDNARQALGILPEEKIDRLIEAFLSQDQAKTLEALHEQSELSLGSLDRVVAQIIENLRERLFKATSASPLMNYALGQLLEAYILQKSSPVARLPLEIACLNICAFSQALPKEVSIKPAETTGILAAAPPAMKSPPPAVVTVPAPVPVPTSEVPVVELRQGSSANIRQAWKEMIDRICQENIALGQALKDTVFHKEEGGTITIHVRFKFHADKMNEKKNSLHIREILHGLTGQEWHINYVTLAATPKRPTPRGLGEGVADAVAVFGPTN